MEDTTLAEGPQARAPLQDGALDAHEIWAEVLDAVRDRIPKPRFDSEFRETVGHEVKDGILWVRVPNAWARSLLEAADNLCDLVKDAAGCPLQVRFREGLIDFDTGEVKPAPAKLADLDDDGLCQWLTALGDARPSWTLFSYGRPRIVRVASNPNLFGPHGDHRPEGIRRPAALLNRYLKDDLRMEDANDRIRVIQLPGDSQ